MVKNKKYYYHVVYGEGFVDYFGSNVSTEYFWHYTPNKLCNEQDTQVITFELNDLPLTKKFITAYKNKIWATTYDYKIRGNTKAFEMISDVYRGLTPDWILESRVKVNEIIDFFNTHWIGKELGFQFPEELKLNEHNVLDNRLPSLNALHELFETHMETLSEYILDKKMDITDDSHDMVWNKLQSVNLIVHYNEKIEVLKEKIWSSPPAYFTSLKFNANTKTEWLLEPEDYKHFTGVRPIGGLQLDFGTVGKDLWHCSNTNDIELVKQKMVSQQWELNPWVQYDWKKCTETEWLNGKEIFKEWCHKNNVGEYYDLSEPRFNPGRHQLGECVSHSFTGPEDFVKQIINKTPKIKYFCITEEDRHFDHIL